MSARFHINDKGVAGRCTAHIRGCVFGVADHFDSKEAANAAISERLEAEFKGFLGGQTKTGETKSRKVREKPLPDLTKDSETQFSEERKSSDRFTVAEIPDNKADWKFESLRRDAEFNIHARQNEVSFLLRAPAPEKPTGPYHERVEGYVDHMDKSLDQAARMKRIDKSQHEALKQDLENFREKVTVINDFAPTSEQKITKINHLISDFSDKVEAAVNPRLTDAQKKEEMQQAMAIKHTAETLKGIIRYYDVEGRRGIAHPDAAAMEGFHRSTHRPVMKTTEATMNERGTAWATGEIRPVQTEFGVIQTYPDTLDRETGNRHFNFRINNQWFRSDNYGDPYEIGIPDEVDPSTGHLRSKGVFGGVTDFFRRRNMRQAG